MVKKTGNLGPWHKYYRGKERKQNLPSESMEGLSRFFKQRGIRTLLDFSCGTGRNAIYLAKRGFDVYGFDRFPQAVNYTKAALNKEHLKAKVMVADMQKGLPYEDGFFDAIIVIRAMYHTKVRAIRRIANDVVRITRPGGFIYIESDQRSVKDEDTTEYKRVSRGTYLYVKGDWKGYYYHVFSKQELLALFKKCRVLRFYFKNDNFRMLVQKGGG